MSIVTALVLVGCRSAKPARQVAFIVPDETEANLESCNALCEPALAEGEKVASCQLFDSYNNVDATLKLRLVYGTRVYVCKIR
jgi:hypothetical protein